MNDTPDAEPTAETPTPARSSPRWMLLAALVGVLVVAGIAGAVAIVNNDDTSDYATSQIGWMHDGCQQWADSNQGADGPDDEWCDSMAGWMNGRMGGDSMMGQGQMMGSMMWQNASNMRTTCEQWMADNPDVASPGADTSARCEQMVDWMDQHMGDWNDWMMNGPG